MIKKNKTKKVLLTESIIGRNTISIVAYKWFKTIQEAYDFDTTERRFRYNIPLNIRYNIIDFNKIEEL